MVAETVESGPGHRGGGSSPFREFSLSESNFAFIRRTAFELTGIKLTDHKKNMIYGRLSRRLRSLKLSTFDDYCQLLADPRSAETDEFINAITTNLTAFFREPHHFEYLADTVFPRLSVANAGSRRIRVWSAGCSTGEEPYSLAIAMLESLPAAGWDIKLLATDLDSNVLAQGRAGIYGTDRIGSVSPERRKRWFLRGSGADLVRVKPALQALVRFKQLNLLGHWPMSGPFDVIFCRNVVIYFDKDTQRRLFDRYADILARDGYLFIGHSESLHKVSDRFRPLGRTVYQKIL